MTERRQRSRGLGVCLLHRLFLHCLLLLLNALLHNLLLRILILFY